MDDIAAKGARSSSGAWRTATSCCPPRRDCSSIPAPGPVLANYGLERLRFVKPVYPGDTIQVRLTCKQKTAKETAEGQMPQGVVAWDVEVTNQNDEPVAVYTILTLVRRSESK